MNHEYLDSLETAASVLGVDVSDMPPIFDDGFGAAPDPDDVARRIAAYERAIALRVGGSYPRDAGEGRDSATNPGYTVRVFDLDSGTLVGEYPHATPEEALMQAYAANAESKGHPGQLIDYEGDVERGERTVWYGDVAAHNEERALELAAVGESGDVLTDQAEDARALGGMVRCAKCGDDVSAEYAVKWPEDTAGWDFGDDFHSDCYEEAKKEEQEES